MKEYESYYIRTEDKNYGKVNIARNNIKKHKKTHLNKKRFATVIITGSLIVYGGVSMIMMV